MYFITDKIIERGCIGSNKLCENDTQCLTCVGDGCNDLSYKNEAIPLNSGGSAASMTSVSFVVTVLLFIAARIASH